MRGSACTPPAAAGRHLAAGCAALQAQALGAGHPGGHGIPLRHAGTAGLRGADSEEGAGLGPHAAAAAGVAQACSTLLTWRFPPCAAAGRGGARGRPAAGGARLQVCDRGCAWCWRAGSKLRQVPRVLPDTASLVPCVPTCRRQPAVHRRSDSPPGAARRRLLPRQGGQRGGRGGQRPGAGAEPGGAVLDARGGAGWGGLRLATGGESRVDSAGSSSMAPLSAAGCTCPAGKQQIEGHHAGRSSALIQRAARTDHAACRPAVHPLPLGCRPSTGPASRPPTSSA